MKIKKLMHAGVHCCAPSDVLQNAAMQMWNHDIGALVVVDTEGRACGMLTDRDIAMAAALQRRPLSEIAVSEVKHGQPVYSCHPRDDVRDALRVMAEHRIRRLLVVDDDGRVAGIVGLKDLVERADVEGRTRRTGLCVNDILMLLQAVCRAPASAPA